MIEAALIKYGLIAVAVIALLGGAFTVGYNHGYSSGYKSGWDAQQKTINKMVTDENLQRDAQNKAITDVEQQAAVAAGQVFAAKAKAALVTTQIITQYKTKYVKIAASCGWSIPTVQTINSVLNANAVAQPAVAASGVAQ